jgi:predicted DNA-binding protein with PD1-like motif
MKTRTLESARMRYFAIVFETGEEVISGLAEFAKTHQIQSGFFFGLGAFQTATLAFFDLQTKEYEHIPVDEQVEVMSITGNVTWFEGEPKIHAHAVVGKRDGSAHGGHVIKAIVRPTLEVFVSVSGSMIERKLDAAAGLPLIDLDIG